MAAATVLLAPTPLAAQALHCPIPRELPRPFIERVPDDEEPVVQPVTGYVLALSWSPQYCAGRGGNPRDRLQCADGRFGFVLHGLWPRSAQGAPRWCAYARRLPEEGLRANLCVSPSVQLIQHQWAKHGTCATSNPRDYLRASAKLFATVRSPDLADRRTLTIDGVKRAFAEANRWLPVSSIGVATTRGDWLIEVKLCLDRAFRPRACDGYERGREDWRRVRVRPVAARP